MEATETKTSSLAAALAAVQAELQDPKPNKKAQMRGRSNYRYAGLDDLLSVVRPVLAAHGVAFTQTLDLVGDRVVLKTRLWVEGGEEVTSLYPMEWKGSHHDKGSEITYARRYSLEAIVGVSATEDDDAHQANRGGGHRQGAGQSRQKQTAAPVEDFEAHRQAREQAGSEHHPSFEAHRGFFFAQLNKHGVPYQEVADACEAKGWGRPSAWTTKKRDGLLQGLADGSAWDKLGLRRAGDETEEEAS